MNVSKPQQIYNALLTHIEATYSQVEPHPTKNEVFFVDHLTEPISLKLRITLRVINEKQISINTIYLPYPQNLTTMQETKLNSLKDKMSKRAGVRYSVDNVSYAEVLEETFILSIEFLLDEKNIESNIQLFEKYFESLVSVFVKHYREDLKRIKEIDAIIRIFVGSATEALPIANVLKDLLTSERYDIILWTDIFPPGKTAIQSLVEQIDKTDLAIFLFTHDDTITIRGHELAITRDNVIFEMGLFAGKLGLERTIILNQKHDKVRMLSDLEGLTVIPFQLTLPSGVKLDIDYKETTSEEQNQHTTQVIHKALGSVIERLNEHIDSVQ
jgi:hypothetical protein